MFIQYIKERKIRLISFYIVGTIITFGFFYTIASFKAPTYRTNFSLITKRSIMPITHTVNNLFELVMLQDSVAFGRLLNLSMNEVGRIKSAEFDILDGNILEFTLVSKDTGIIIPFYKALITYLNSDSLLNNEIFFNRDLLDNEINLIEKEMAQFKSNPEVTDSMNWQLTMGSSQSTPVIGSSNSIHRVFLYNRLNELSIKKYYLVTVEALNSPIIPLKSEKVGKKVYFIFSNIIVLSLLFIQYLFVTNTNSEN